MTRYVYSQPPLEARLVAKATGLPLIDRPPESREDSLVLVVDSAERAAKVPMLLRSLPIAAIVAWRLQPHVVMRLLDAGIPVLNGVPSREDFDAATSGGWDPSSAMRTAQRLDALSVSLIEAARLAPQPDIKEEDLSTTPP